MFVNPQQRVRRRATSGLDIRFGMQRTTRTLSGLVDPGIDPRSELASVVDVLTIGLQSAPNLPTPALRARASTSTSRQGTIGQS